MVEAVAMRRRPFGRPGWPVPGADAAEAEAIIGGSSLDCEDDDGLTSGMLRTGNILKLFKLFPLFFLGLSISVIVRPLGR